MKFAAIHDAVVRAFSVTDEILGCWLRLQLHVSKLESGIGWERSTRYRRIGTARLRGAQSWDEHQWLRSTGTTPAAVLQVVEAGMARWRGADLIVEGYDLFAQKRSTENLKRLLGFIGVNNPPKRPQHPAIAGSTSGALSEAPSGWGVGATSPSPSPSDPDLPSGALGESTHPFPKGGAGGTPGGDGAGMRAPLGAGDPGTGPEGFERWWGGSYPKAFANWREGVLELWVARDLEGEADVVIAYTEHQKRTRQWRQRGPKGEPHHYVPTPWRLLTKEEWRKPGPWNAPPAAPPPPRPRSSDTQPEVVAAGLVDVTVPHDMLEQLLGDPDIDEQTKERHRRRWTREHPGQQPPWSNGRAS